MEVWFLKILGEAHDPIGHYILRFLFCRQNVVSFFVVHKKVTRSYVANF